MSFPLNSFPLSQLQCLYNHTLTSNFKGKSSLNKHLKGCQKLSDGHVEVMQPWVWFVYSLLLAFNLWQLYLCFKIHKSSFMKIILMNKTYKNHKSLLAAELFSAIIQKPKENSYWVFVKQTRVIQTWVGLQNISLRCPFASKKH